MPEGIHGLGWGWGRLEKLLKTSPLCPSSQSTPQSYALVPARRFDELDHLDVPAEGWNALKGRWGSKNGKLKLIAASSVAPWLGESHGAVFRFDNIQTVLSTMTPHIKPLMARSKIRTGKDQEPWSP